EGVLTLAQLQSPQGGEFLRQLATEPKLPYDLTPAQLQTLELHVACPLSALAPRMRYLQTDIFEPNALNLAADARLLDQFEQANRGSAPVQTWWSATRAQRRFLPAEEGGDDRGPRPGLGSRQARAEAELVPLHVVPPQIMALPGDLKTRLLSLFSQRFRNLY